MTPGRSGLRTVLAGAGKASLWAFVLIAVAAVVNLMGVRMAGDHEAWQIWMKDHSAWFFVWRLLLNAGTGAGWLWMRRRLTAREPDRATHLRLLRVEIAAVVAFIALEASLLLRSA